MTAMTPPASWRRALIPRPPGRHGDSHEVRTGLTLAFSYQKGCPNPAVPSYYSEQSRAHAHSLQSLPTHVHHQILLDLPASGTCTFLCRDIAQGGTAMERPLTLSQLARATGMPAKTIRYYEQIGVWPGRRRRAAGYGQYCRHDVHRLLFIRRARALGLSLTNLKELTAELASGECLTMRPRLHALVAEQLRTVQRQIAEFQVLERQLTQVLHRAQTAAPLQHTDG